MSEPTKEQIAHMVQRFLGWRLPEDFRPDGGISFKATFNEHTAHPMRHEPTGTNLLDAIQAEAMVRHMLDGMPALAAETAPLHEKIEKLNAALDALLEVDRARKAYSDSLEKQLEQKASGTCGLCLAAINGLPEGVAWSISGGGHDKRSVEIVTPDGDVVAEVFGSPAHLETAQQRAEAICAARRPSIPEKQPSPAAAPAQISEALRAALAEVKRMTSVGPPVPPGRKPAPGEGWYNLVLRVNAFAAAALAGQPAPTEDREALRAALERIHGFAQNGIQGTPKAAQDLCWKINTAVADLIRALAGSPAQHGKKGGG